MQQITSRIVFVLALIIAMFFAMFWTSSTHARFSYPDAPPYVRLSGVLLPLGVQDNSELRTLIVFVHGQLWRFRLDAVEEVIDGHHRRLHLRDLRKSSVRLYGSDILMNPLQQPEIAGKHIAIEGHLYAKERRLLVTAVEETPAVARSH